MAGHMGDKFRTMLNLEILNQTLIIICSTLKVLFLEEKTLQFFKKNPLKILKEKQH